MIQDQIRTNDMEVGVDLDQNLAIKVTKLHIISNYIIFHD